MTVYLLVHLYLSSLRYTDINQDRFYNAMFRLTDKWTDSISATAYSAFLSSTFNELTFTDDNGVMRWRDEKSILKRRKVGMMAKKSMMKKLNRTRKKNKEKETRATRDNNRPKSMKKGTKPTIATGATEGGRQAVVGEGGDGGEGGDSSPSLATAPSRTYSTPPPDFMPEVQEGDEDAEAAPEGDAEVKDEQRKERVARMGEECKDAQGRPLSQYNPMVPVEMLNRSTLGRGIAGVSDRMAALNAMPTYVPSQDLIAAPFTDAAAALWDLQVRRRGNVEKRRRGEEEGREGKRRGGRGGRGGWGGWEGTLFMVYVLLHVWARLCVAQ